MSYKLFRNIALASFLFIGTDFLFHTSNKNIKQIHRKFLPAPANRGLTKFSLDNKYSGCLETVPHIWNKVPSFCNIPNIDEKQTKNMSLEHRIKDLYLIKKIKTGYYPKSVEISPDKKLAYVNNLEDCSVWIYDTSTKKPIKKIKFQKTPTKVYDNKLKKMVNSFEEKPVESTFSEGGRYVWISLHNSKCVVIYDVLELNGPAEGKDIVIDDLVDGTRKKIKIKKIETGNTPKEIAISPDGAIAYVSNWHSSSITAIDAKEFRRIKDIPLGDKQTRYIP